MVEQSLEGRHRQFRAWRDLRGGSQSVSRRSLWLIDVMQGSQGGSKRDVGHRVRVPRDMTVGRSLVRYPDSGWRPEKRHGSSFWHNCRKITTAVLQTRLLTAWEKCAPSRRVLCSRQMLAKRAASAIAGANRDVERAPFSRFSVTGRS